MSTFIICILALLVVGFMYASAILYGACRFANEKAGKEEGLANRMADLYMEEQWRADALQQNRDYWLIRSRKHEAQVTDLTLGLKRKETENEELRVEIARLKLGGTTVSP